METLMAISVTVIAAIMVLALIFLIPVLLQVRRTAKEAEKLIDLVGVQVVPISRDIGLISQDVQSITQFIHRQADRVETEIETVHDMAVRVKEFKSKSSAECETSGYAYFSLGVFNKVLEPWLELSVAEQQTKHSYQTESGGSLKRRPNCRWD